MLYSCWDSGFPDGQQGQIRNRFRPSELQLWRELMSGSTRKWENQIPCCAFGLGCCRVAVLNCCRHRCLCSEQDCWKHGYPFTIYFSFFAVVLRRSCHLPTFDGGFLSSVRVADFWGAGLWAGTIFVLDSCAFLQTGSSGAGNAAAGHLAQVGPVPWAPTASLKRNNVICF